MTHFISSSASILRKAALAALLLGTTSYVLPAHAQTAPAQQVAEQGDARDSTSYRIGTAEGDAGEGQFRIGTAEGDAGEGQFRIGTAEGDAGEGAFLRAV